jgi:nifR3 family TIM-barrel protein
VKNFWQKLEKGFFCLAPMYDVTDAAFRQMFVKYGKPNVLFTEFVSADGLASDEGRKKLLRELYFTEEERPIVAQIFGSQPETIGKAVKLIKDLGFDGVDINMGCPDKAVEKQGAGSALIKNPKLAQEIMAVAKKAAGSMPVSVKTRLGYNKIDYDWIKTIIEAKPDAVTFHLRTRKELSEAPAHWEEASKLAQMGHKAGVVVICNGDVPSVAEGQILAQKHGVDGIMIGRGAFGQPWLFAGDTEQGEEFLKVWPKTQSEEIRGLFKNSSPCSGRLKILIEHSKIFWDLYGPTETNQKLFNGHTKNFAVMRKHFKAYVSGFKGATTLRVKLMQTQNPDEVEAIVAKFIIS